MLFEVSKGRSGLQEAIANLCKQAEDSVTEGVNYIVLSDREVDATHAAIPSLLAVSAVHHHLISVGKRVQTALIVESGEIREVMHERLSIVDPQSGGQPLYSPDRKQILAVNGEIYNHREIRSKYAGKYAFQTGSDCEVILALYKDKGINFLEDLNGIFAFALYDEETDDFLIARDPIGVIPLYIGKDADGKVYCASELKALEGFCEEYEPFLPGHYYWGREGKMHRWYKRDWMEYDAVKDNDAKVSDVHDWKESSILSSGKN